MKKKGHPPYQEVLFIDSSNGAKFICGSTLQPQETETFEGKEYPVYRVAISSASHPFFTGSKQFIDTEGRVDKFTKRYQKKREDLTKQKQKQDEAEEAKKISAKKRKVKKAPTK